MKKVDYNNNKGFSFIEMLVSVLITGILMLAIGIFMSTSRYAYETVSTSAKLQEEALSADNFINEMMMEAKAYGELEIAGLNVTNDETYSGDVKVLWSFGRDNDSNSNDFHYYFLILEEKTGKLRYMKAPSSANAGITYSRDISTGKWDLSINSTDRDAYIVGAVGNKYKLISECVTDIIVDEPHEQGNSVLISVELKLAFNSTDFTTNIKTLSRNIRLN